MEETKKNRRRLEYSVLYPKITEDEMEGRWAVPSSVVGFVGMERGRYGERKIRLEERQRGSCSCSPLGVVGAQPAVELCQERYMSFIRGVGG